MDQTLCANRRADGLYHAYNTLHLGENTATVDSLYEMLEGQVAVLSSGLLDSREALALLHCLRESRLYGADQHSYILYLDRDLPGFLAKDHLSADRLRGSSLPACLAERKDRSLLIRILLRREELIVELAHFAYVGRDGGPSHVALSGSALAFTFCQTPIVLVQAQQAAIEVTFADGRTQAFTGKTLDRALSASILCRDGLIQCLTVSTPLA